MIESAKNPKIIAVKKLKDSKWISKERATLVQSPKILAEILRDQPGSVLEIFKTRDSELPPQLMRWTHSKIHTVTSSVLNAISIQSGGFPLAVVRTPEAVAMDTFKTLLNIAVLPLQDPKNLGAAVRSGLAFGCQGVILHGSLSAHLFHPDCTRASAGLNFRVPFTTLSSFEELSLLDPQFSFYHLDASGTPLSQALIHSKRCLLIGQEGKGVAVYSDAVLSNLKSMSLRIPISPQVESLNAMVATSIAWYHFQEHQDGKGINS